MNALLTLTARELVGHLATVRSDDDIASACDGALTFLRQQGCSPMQLRTLVPAVRRALRAHARVVPAHLTTPAGHAGEAASRIASSLTGALHAKIDLTEHADPGILGGATLAVGDERLDVSLRGALRQLEYHLAV